MEPRHEERPVSILLGLDGLRSYGAVVSAEFKDFPTLVHSGIVVLGT